MGSNSTRSVSYDHFEWAFPSRAKSRVDERRPIAFKTRKLSPSGRNEKTPLGSNSTRSVSYHHFPSRAKRQVDKRRPIAFKTRFFDFPHRGETKKHPFGSNSTRLVSYCHFDWAFPSRAKSRVDERRPIAFKTRFFDFPHRGETKKHPWDRIPRGRFHTTIFGLFQAGQKGRLTNVVQLRSKRVFSTFPIGAKRKNTLSDRIPRGWFHTAILTGLFQAGQKAALTNVVQLRSKRVFSTFPIGAKRKNNLGIKFHEVGFIRPF